MLVMLLCPLPLLTLTHVPLLLTMVSLGGHGLQGAVATTVVAAIAKVVRMAGITTHRGELVLRKSLSRMILTGVFPGSGGSIGVIPMNQALVRTVQELA